jgi:hypothetical protein
MIEKIPLKLRLSNLARRGRKQNCARDEAP